MRHEPRHCIGWCACGIIGFVGADRHRLPQYRQPKQPGFDPEDRKRRYRLQRSSGCRLDFPHIRLGAANQAPFGKFRSIPAIRHFKFTNPAANHAWNRLFQQFVLLFAVSLGVDRAVQFGVAELFGGAAKLAGGEAAIQAAQNLANGLNGASAAVQNVRLQADQGMASSVDTINSLLSQFTQLNNQIVSGSQSGADISDAMDQRDSVLQQLSGQIGITTVTRSNNDVAIYTDSGVTLFDKSARAVSFDPTSDFSASTQGNAVYADGVPITAQGSPMSIHSGALAGYAAVRDQIAPTYESQLDEVARGLITQFQETDQSGANPPATSQAGLFTNGSSLSVPVFGTAVPGLAATIQVWPMPSPTQPCCAMAAFPRTAREFTCTTPGARKEPEPATPAA